MWQIDTENTVCQYGMTFRKILCTHSLPSPPRSPSLSLLIAPSLALVQFLWVFAFVFSANLVNNKMSHCSKNKYSSPAC